MPDASPDLARERMREPVLREVLQQPRVNVRRAADRDGVAEAIRHLLEHLLDAALAAARVARMLDRSEAACRQLATRARRAVRNERPAPATAPDNHARLLIAFGEAVASGDVSRLAGLLRADAIAFTDGGGRKTAALNPIMGADKIGRFFSGVMKKNLGSEIRIEPAMINGSVGAVLYLDNEIDSIMSMAIDGERIAAIYIVRNPDKLRHMPIAIRH